jgi:hypothetical protein
VPDVQTAEVNGYIQGMEIRVNLRLELTRLRITHSPALAAEPYPGRAVIVMVIFGKVIFGNKQRSAPGQAINTAFSGCNSWYVLIFGS